jgi:tetratricopeptide (TPR) repeat protein
VSESCHGEFDPARWQRVRELFDDVVERDPAARAARLAVVCEGDPDLRREVESLLAHDQPPHDHPEHPDRPDHPTHDALGEIVAAAARVVVEPRDVTWPAPEAVGHYRILDKLGEGGMGEVFLAEDTVLGRRVALKLPTALLAGDAEACARLQREARAAATINHPHVCVVHEVGEAADGRPFIVMEYLEGETLAARLTRQQRLTPDEVLTLGCEAADALAAAHARGVVHRDLKPSNIILTPHGLKLLDFGLASVARDAVARQEEAGAFMGTLRYMSPEQRRGEALDARTDLFSLGVVLYEAATGCRPFDVEGKTPRAVRQAILDANADADADATPVPSTRLASDLPAGFDRVISRALATDRDQRYQTAIDLAADLGRLGPLASPSRARRGWIVWATAAAALGIAAIVGIVAVARANDRAISKIERSAIAPKTTVLVAGFSNTTGDASFDGTLREALIVQLQQTPFLTIFPDAGVGQTLRLMMRSPDEPLTPTIAQEIVARRGIAAWITGSIAPVGSRYALSLTASSGSGAVLARERVEAAGKQQVLAALGDAAVRLRRTLGESTPTIQTFSTPVEEATTASLDALKAYTLGVERSRHGDYATAASLFQRAVQIDPDFALAQQALAREELNSSSSDRVVTAATRAFELRGRTTAREQAIIVYFYHRAVTGDLDQAIAAASQWKQTYPAEWRPYTALADAYWSTGEYAQMEEAARAAMPLNPDAATAYSNLAGALYALGRFDEAREVYRQAMDRGFDAPEYHAFLWRMAFLTGDEEAMRRQLDWAESSSTWALNILAESLTLQGRWRDAQARTAQTAALFDTRGMPGLATRALSYEMMDAALFGDCAASRRSIPRVLTSQLHDEQAEAMLVMALCGEPDRAVRLGEALRARRPLDTLINRIWLPSIQAAAALAHGQPRQAIEQLRVTEAYEGAAESWPIYLRALALSRAGDGEAARAEFEKLLQHQTWSFWPPLAPLAHLGRARVAAMTGDVETAAHAYQDLFKLWSSADADLPVLVEARREYSRLARLAPLAPAPLAPRQRTP